MIVGEAPAGCEKPAPGALVAFLAAGILLGSSWGGSGFAHAATCIGEACDDRSRCPLEDGRELARFDMHPVANTVEPAQAPALDAAGTESMAPFLYLTPRVATILDQIFGDDEAAARLAAAEEAPAEDPQPALAADETQEMALPPVAGTEQGPGAAPYEPLVLPDNASGLPKFQRQMYRTDI